MAPHVHVTHGAIENGLWCDHCLTHAAYACRLYVLTSTGEMLNLGTERGCATCGDSEED